MIDWKDHVNCRIGSLEKDLLLMKIVFLVNCRIGSLESRDPQQIYRSMVNCRIGSLETLLSSPFPLG